MEVPATVIALGNWVLENSHRAVLGLTGGRFPHRLLGMQLLELHTVGRKTGKRRSTLLAAPVCEENRVVLVASKGGYPEDPIWYKNLVAHPEVEITIQGRTRHMRARTATREEKAALWPTLVKANKGYDDYQRRTERDIPVVICEPVEPGS